MLTDVNFKIIEQNTNNEELEQKFIKIYNNYNYKVKDIPAILGISTGTLNTLRKNLHKKGKIILRNTPFEKRTTAQKGICNHIYPKNFRQDRKEYYEIRYRNGEYYGSCISYEEAEEVVRRLEECGWDKSKFNDIKYAVRRGE